MLKQTPIYETLTAEQKKRLWDYLVSIGLPLNPPPKPRKPRVSGEGTPGRRPDWWHGNGSSFTRRMVAKHGYFKDARGGRAMVGQR